MSLPQFRALIRFVPNSDDSQVLIGEPEDEALDVGTALRRDHQVEVLCWSGSSVLSPGSKTERIETVKRVLSPLGAHEVGTIRCIGLNVSVTPSKQM